MKRKSSIVLEYSTEEIFLMVKRGIENRESVSLTEMKYDPITGTFIFPVAEKAQPELFAISNEKPAEKHRRQYGLLNLITETFVPGAAIEFEPFAKEVTALGFRTSPSSLKWRLKSLGITDLENGTWQLIVKKAQ